MDHAQERSAASPAPQVTGEAGVAVLKSEAALQEKAFAADDAVSGEPSPGVLPLHGESPAQEQKQEHGEHAQERVAGASAQQPGASPHQPAPNSHFAIQLGESTSDHAPDPPHPGGVQPAHPVEEWAAPGRSGQPSVSLEVQPPEVGRVRLHVALAGERVYATVITEQAGVRDYLLTQEPRLAGGLSAQGLEIGAFQVAVEHQGEGQPDYREAAAWVRPGNQDGARGQINPEPESPGGPTHQEPPSQLQVLSLFA
jgi:flagellar hook-length control protein FliK